MEVERNFSVSEMIHYAPAWMVAHGLKSTRPVTGTLRAL